MRRRFAVALAGKKNSTKTRAGLESDNSGRFRIKPVPRKAKHTQWVSPDIAKILQESGVAVEGDSGALATDEYYDDL
jgi:hypothetical protein